MSKVKKIKNFKTRHTSNQSNYCLLYDRLEYKIKKKSKSFCNLNKF